MKSQAVLLLALSTSSLMAGVKLGGGTVFKQNFDTLPSVTGSTWTNAVTLPDWYLFRTVADSPTPVEAPIIVNDNDPFTAWAGGLYSLGSLDGTDRALGSSPTTSVGNYGHIVILQNNSASPMRITQVKYKVENWRENTTAGIVEHMVFGTRAAATETALISSLGTGFTDIPALSATIDHSGVAAEVNDPAREVQVNAAPPSAILIPAGNFMALRWLNANDGGSDAYLGLDDVEITYEQVATALDAAAANVVRDSKGTSNPADDTVSFSATITGLGALSPAGWTRTSAPAGVTGPASGGYGTAVIFSNIPVNAATQAFVFRDAAAASAQRTLNITIPPPPAELTAASGPLRITFETPALGAASFTRDFDDPTTDLGWTSGLPASAGNGVRARLDDTAANHYFRLNGARLTAAAGPLVTEPVRIAGLAAVSVGISVTSYTTSATGFEDAAAAPTILNSDRLQCHVEVSTDGITWTQNGGGTLIDPATTGPALFEATKLIDEAGGNVTGMNHFEDIAGAFTSLPDPVPFTVQRRISLVPGASQYARLVLLGGNDSASENMLFDNIEFNIPRNVVTATASAFTYNNQNNNNPADDTWSFTVTVTNQDPLRPQGWTGDGGVNGTYGTGVVFGPFPVSATPRTILLKDAADPSVTHTLTVDRPAATLGGTIALLSRQEGATSSYEDDVWTARANLTATGASTGWVETATGITGLYGTPADLGSFPVSDGAQSFVFQDLGDSTLESSAVVLDPPSRPVVGVVSIGGVDRDLLNVLTDAASSVAWRAGAEPWTSEQNNGGGTVPHVLRSAPVNLTAAGGAVTFSAELEARDTSTGTNFESNDTFRIDLELTGPGGAVTTVPLITSAQDTGDGASSAALNGPPNGVLNGFTGAATTVDGVAVTAVQDYDTHLDRDEFNIDGLDSAGLPSGFFQWTYQIPAGFTSASVLVTALNNSASEFYTVRNVRFTAGGTAVTDSDGDGASDDAELTAGTNPNDPASVFRIRSLVMQPAAGPTPAALEVRVPTVANRFYQLYSSANLQTWTREDNGGSTTGDGTEKLLRLNITPGIGNPRRFLRLHVRTDNQFPATVP
ncbi:MAG: hypothetical protein EOP86_03475 [Verrucomicrobiaceae bacterium]|nr:MAG: hypothetical protein EOP86_03475 [Verrucomicrobiaceae bacterium]